MYYERTEKIVSEELFEAEKTFQCIGIDQYGIRELRTNKNTTKLIHLNY